MLDAIEVLAQPGGGPPPATEPPGPAELAAIAERWGIEFWTGPVRE